MGSFDHNSQLCEFNRGGNKDAIAWQHLNTTQHLCKQVVRIKMVGAMDREYIHIYRLYILKVDWVVEYCMLYIRVLRTIGCNLGYIGTSWPLPPVGTHYTDNQMAPCGSVPVPFAALMFHGDLKRKSLAAEVTSGICYFRSDSPCSLSLTYRSTTSTTTITITVASAAAAPLCQCLNICINWWHFSSSKLSNSIIV